MDPARLRPPELLVLFNSVALVVALFSRWYTFDASGEEMRELSAAGFPDSLSGWSALGGLDIALVLLAFGGLSIVLAFLLTNTPAIEIPACVFTMIIGFVAVIWTLVRVVNPPGPNLDPAAGAYVGLGAAVLITAGAIWSNRSEAVPAPPPQPVPDVLETPAP